jgi:hypothetical protein
MVFARSLYEQPLSLQGEFEAADEVSAGGVALERFGGEWVELSVVPESEVRWILRSDQQTHDEEPAT